MAVRITTYFKFAASYCSLLSEFDWNTSEKRRYEQLTVAMFKTVNNVFLARLQKC